MDGPAVERAAGDVGVPELPGLESVPKEFG